MLRRGILRPTSLLVGLFFLLASRPASALTIDTFQAFQGPVSDSGTGGLSDSMSSPAGTIVPGGGSRDLFAEKINEKFGRARVLVAGALFYTSDADVEGQFAVDYADLSGVDLSSAEGIAISGTLDPSASVDGGTTLGVMMRDMSLNEATSAVTLNTADFTHSFAASDFAGVDLSQVDHIRLGSFDAGGSMVDVPAGGDVTIRSLEAIGVPEPQNLTLAAVLSGILIAAGRALLCRRSLCGASSNGRL